MLYTVVSSHPSIAVELMLRHKGLAYRRIELPAGLSHPLLRLRGFGAELSRPMRIGARKVENSLLISRVVDEIPPGPPLVPRECRTAIEDAERWGEDFQPCPPD